MLLHGGSVAESPESASGTNTECAKTSATAVILAIYVGVTLPPKELVIYMHLY